ncbi:MAG: carboxypeptidase-like regulatory domain-containing protein, partial [Acidobacteria bacterium]|nr:carboxypeptidase-like regulatory domain-containing protein [Acidobacteriota bacterium]
MSGTIKDPNGAVIPGAKIVATHVPTNREFPAQTTDAGLYVLPSLPPGPYTVSVEQPGFKKLVRSGIEIRLGQRQDLDLNLEVGDVQQK